jgi:hypothetical protein
MIIDDDPYSLICSLSPVTCVDSSSRADLYPDHTYIPTYIHISIRIYTYPYMHTTPTSTHLSHSACSDAVGCLLTSYSCILGVQCPVSTVPCPLPRKGPQCSLTVSRFFVHCHEPHLPHLPHLPRSIHDLTTLLTANGQLKRSIEAKTTHKYPS